MVSKKQVSECCEAKIIKDSEVDFVRIGSKVITTKTFLLKCSSCGMSPWSWKEKEVINDE